MRPHGSDFLATETSPQDPLKRAQFGIAALGCGEWSRDRTRVYR